MSLLIQLANYSLEELGRVSSKGLYVTEELSQLYIWPEGYEKPEVRYSWNWSNAEEIKDARKGFLLHARAIYTKMHAPAE